MLHLARCKRALVGRVAAACRSGERTNPNCAHRRAAAEGAPYYFEKVISYMFWADIALNFRTGYVHVAQPMYMVQHATLRTAPDV